MASLKYKDENGQWQKVGIGNIGAVLDTHNVDKNAHPDKATTVTYTAIIPAVSTANDDGLYLVEVAVNGILATDNPIVDVDFGSDQEANKVYVENMGKVFYIVTMDNTISVALTDATTSAFPIQLKVVR